MNSLALSLIVPIAFLVSCASSPRVKFGTESVTDSVSSFKVRTSDDDEKPNYLTGFIAYDSAGSLPTQIFLWRTTTLWSNATMVNSRHQPTARVGGKPFEFPTSDGRGVFAIDPQGRPKKMQLEANVLDLIEDAVRPSYTRPKDTDALKDLVVTEDLISRLWQIHEEPGSHEWSGAQT